MIELPIHRGLDCEHEVHCATCTVDPAWRADTEQAWGTKLVCPLGKVLHGETPPVAPRPAVARPAPTPQTPEQHEAQHEAHRQAALFGAMVSAGYASAGGTGECGGCGDARYANLARMWQGCNPPTGDDPFESICAGLVLLEIYGWLSGKVGDITKEQWAEAQDAMRRAYAASPPATYVPTPGGPCEWFARVIHETTGADWRACSRCVDHCRQLDEWGWTGSALHAVTIARWLRYEAKERKIKVRLGTIAIAMRAAFGGRV